MAKRLVSTVAFSVSADLWTSEAKDHYLGCAAHFIDESVAFHTVFVGVHTISGHADHAAVVTALKFMFQKLGIDLEEQVRSRKLFAMISDGGGNLRLAAQDLKTRHERCAAHAINNVVQTCLKAEPWKGLVDKCAAVVQRFHKSCVAMSALREQMAKGGSAFESLVDRNDTRWNSTYHMVKRLREVQPAIVQARASLGDAAAAELTTADFVLLLALEDVLAPFENVTKLLEYKGSHLGGLQYEVFDTLAKKCVAGEGELDVLVQLKAALRSGIIQKWNEVLGTSVVPAMTLLDPRTKNLEFLSDKKKRMEVEAKGKSVVGELVLGHPWDDDELPKKKRAVQFIPSDTGFAAMLAHILPSAPCPAGTTHVPLSEQFEREYVLYRAEAQTPPTEDPFAWWKSLRHRYPLLFGAFCMLFSAPVECERIFSEAGLLAGGTRSSLGRDTVDNILTVRRNCE